ncbi:MAG: hypothetical protein QME42_10670 [bacterium]|nr:hypothetical protein [bacterium]
MQRRIGDTPLDPAKIIKMTDVVMVIFLLIILLISYLAYREGIVGHSI